MDKARLLTVSAEAREWMQRRGLCSTPQHHEALTPEWVDAEVRAARYAGRDHYDDSRAGYLLDCRRRGEDAEMRSPEECWETWLLGRDYVPEPDGPLEVALREAFRCGWETARDS